MASLDKNFSLDEVSEIFEDYYDENVIEQAFIVGENDPVIKSPSEILADAVQKDLRGFSTDKDSIRKNIEGSTQSRAELSGTDLMNMEVVNPPYPPELLSMFLEVDETNFRCVSVKVTDYVGRDFSLEPVESITPDDEPGLSQGPADKEVKIINDFIRDANEIIGFRGVIEKAAMDYEAIGWGAIEVIRSRDMQVRKIVHVPATRIKVLKGWGGFVEVVDNGGKKIFYQNFGEKVVSKKRKHPITNKPLPYIPEEDGKLTSSKAQWNFIDRETGEPGRSFKNSANEIIWCPKHHSNTIYYGYSDAIAAIGHLLAKIHIRDYLLQFFEHNTIPRYAIVIEGAQLADKVKETIIQYFSTHIKGKAHKTLIIPIPAMKGEVKLRFEKLAADQQEGSFLETQKTCNQAIMTAYGVSPAIIGIAEHSELGSGKGLSQAEIYKDRIVTPGQKRWEFHLNRLFRLGLGVQSIALKFDPLDIRDREAEQRLLTEYKNAGALTIDELREKAGLGGPLEGGNRTFILAGKQVLFLDELLDMTSGAIESKEEKERKEQENKERLEAMQNVPGEGKPGEGKPGEKPPFGGKPGEGKPGEGKPPIPEKSGEKEEK